MKQIGAMLNANTAALVVLGESRLQQKLQQAVTHAVQQYECQAPVDSAEFDKDFDQMVNELPSSWGTETTGASPNA